MATPVNYWKLGLFASLGLGALFFALVALGASKFDEVRLGFVTYYDESVSGLEVGSPVKFRGAPIGRVDGIRIAPDRRHVEVQCSVTAAALKRLGLKPGGEATGSEPDQFVPPELRTQLVSAALTGTKFVQIDFFNPKQHPLPGLPFPIPKNHIPATPSTFASLESSITSTAARLPDLIKQASDFLAKLDTFVGKIDIKHLNDASGETLTEARDLLRELRAEVKRVDAGGIAKRGAKVLDQASATLDRTDRILVRINAKDGLLTDLELAADDLRQEMEALKLATKVDKTIKSMDKTLAAVEKTANAFTNTAKSTRGLGDDLSRTLNELRRAAKSIRKLADTLDRDSDMLLKGRSRK